MDRRGAPVTGIARSFSLVAVAQLITLAATFLFTLAQARYLAPESFGELSVALSVNAILMLVVDFGLGTKLPRDVAQHPLSAGRSIAAALVVRTGLWCIAMPVVWLATLLLGYDAELRTIVLILGVSGLIGGVASTLQSYYQGREKFLFPSLGTLMHRGAAAGIGIAALLLGHGVVIVATAYAAASLLQVLVMLPGLRWYPVQLSVPDRTAIATMLKGTATLGVFWMLGAFYYNVDMLILQQLAPAENVAWYAAAYRLFGVALVVVNFASSMVLYPVISRLTLGPRPALRDAMAKAFALLAAAGMFVALAIGFTADQVIAFVFPAHAYAPAADALRLLAPAIVAIYANGPFFMLVLAMRRDRQLLVMSAVLAVLNPLANMVFIPVFQQNAAALITTATEAVVIAWLVALTPRELRRAADARVIARIAVAAAPAAACLWLLRDVTFLVSVPLAAAAYLAACVGLGVIPAGLLPIVGGLARRAPRRDAAPGSAPLAAHREP